MHSETKSQSTSGGAAVRQASTTLTWFALRAASQFGLVLLLSRHLGSAGYGIFVTAMAVASFFVPFAGLGLQAILLREGARNPSLLATHLWHCIRIVALATPIAVGFGVAYLLFVLPDDVALPKSAMLAALCVEVAALSIGELVARAEQARERMGRYGLLNTAVSLLRLTILMLLAATDAVTVEIWLWACAVSGLLYLLGCLAYARIMFPARLKPIKVDMRRWLKQSLPFAWGALSLRLQAEYNKPQLARISFESSGVFNVAQRGMDMLNLPVIALQEALWARFYRTDSSRARWRIWALLLGMALAVALACLLLAPGIPKLVGSDYLLAADVLRLMAGLPLLQCVRSLLTVQLTHVHRTAAVGYAYMAGAISSVLLTTWLVQSSGLIGAVTAFYAVEAIIISILAASIYLKKKAI